MKQITKRIKKLSRLEYILKKVRKYAYVETGTLIIAFLLIGYMVNPHDICLTQEKVPYLLIILAILTLFHGFESAFVAMSLISFSMWYFYEQFPYVPFLVSLMMVLIFSEFHYYWTKKIRELKIDDDYKASKLNELSKAFYSLKISHDQLEKNYVLKPMSIRSAIEEILLKKKTDNKEDKLTQSSEQYQDFLTLLEKSFNVQSGLIIHKVLHHEEKTLTLQNASTTYSPSFEGRDENALYKDYMIQHALERKKPIFVSDVTKNPTLEKRKESKFLAVIPTIYDNEIVSILAIEKMPFMAFNKENLISIAILLEYLSIQIYQEETWNQSEKMQMLFPEHNFKYECCRLKYLHNKYKINSTLLIIKIDNELQTLRVSKKIQQLLRSLDILSTTKNRNSFYLVVLFPLNDQAVALGFLNRLLYNLKNEKDKNFDYMTFSIIQEDLIFQYITDDYHG